MFYPPKGRLLAESCRSPIVFTYVLFWVSKTLVTFQFTAGFLQKKKPGNVLSPEGTSACRLQRGPFVFTYVLFCIRKRIFDF